MKHIFKIRAYVSACCLLLKKTSKKKDVSAETACSSVQKADELVSGRKELAFSCNSKGRGAVMHESRESVLV